jgi:hypothetical protein
MKNINIALIALATILTASCSEEFVTPVHNSSEPLDEYFNTEARMFESLVAAYDPLEWFDYSFGQYCSIPLFTDIMGDDINCGGSNEGDQPVLVKTHFYQLTSQDVLSTIWTICYSGINRSNVVRQYVDGVEGMTDATRNQWVAEALVLRCFYYNMLWKCWGNIPYYEDNLKEPYFTEQLGHDQVYENVVKTLEGVFEKDALPMKSPVGQEGRVTKAMALMLYAEMVMYQNDQTRYQKALDGMKEIISSKQYSLVADFASIWEESGEWGSESIWEINYTSEGSPRDWGNNGITTGGNVYSTLIGIPGGPKLTGALSGRFYDGWGFGTVNEEAYKMYNEGDIRRDGGILNASDQRSIYDARWEDTGYFLLKYIAKQGGNHGAKGDVNMGHGNNIRMYRYAETLLNAAELAVLLNQDGTAWLKEVRDRAHCTDTGTTRDDIITERRKEFLGEGKRYWDLVRSGLASTVLTSANHPFRPAGSNWTESKKYWPIPQSEMDKDNKLTQNNY